VIRELAQVLSPALLEQLFTEIKNVPLKDYDIETVDFVKTLTQLTLSKSNVPFSSFLFSSLLS
jgi:hypothetical protein